MNYTDFINRAVEPYRKFGYEEYENGARAFARATYIAPLAFLHRLFPPLNEAQIQTMERALNVTLPPSLRSFYECFNGFQLFMTFSIYGLRSGAFSRSVDIVQQYPFDIMDYNSPEKFEDAGKNMLVFGGYSWNGSKLWMDLETEHVHYCEKGSLTSLIEWNSLGEMLEAEINRLIEMHTVEGKNIPFRPTVPTGGEDVKERLIARARENEKKPYWYDESIHG